MGFSMIYHITHSADYLGYLILGGKNREKKQTKTRPNTKLLPVFNGRNNNYSFISL